MHTGNQKYDIILAKEFQQHMTKQHRKNGVSDQGKNNKRFMEIKQADRQYNVKDNDDVTHQDVRMYYNINHFPELKFCGPHSKPHGARGSSKNNHLRFDQKLGNGICVILCIPYACVACTSMLEKPWLSGIS